MLLALITSTVATVAVASDEALPPGPEAGWLEPLTVQQPVELANCGPWTCTPSQDCIYCGSSFYCKPDGYTCCYPDFCTPTEECIYCGSSTYCKPKGYTCCYPDFCDTTQECIICGAFKSCYPKGSSCCFGSICRPDQTCDLVSRRCVSSEQRQVS
jgi:hypothetical protein